MSGGAKSCVIGRLLNGNLTKLKSILINKKYYTIENTCAYDSLSQVLFCSYADSDCYRQFIDDIARKNDGLVFEFIKKTVRDGVTVQSYRKRAHVLLSVHKFPCTKIGETIRVNAICTVLFLIEKLFIKYPTYKEVRICNECKQKSRRSGASMEMTLPAFNVTSLQDMITEFVTFPAKCRKPKCDAIVQRDWSFSSHLFVEIFPPYVENNLRGKMSVPLSDIPQQVTVLGKTFTIRGVILFKPPLSNNRNAVGHYTAYCWRSLIQRWQLYDDMIDSKTVTYVKNSSVIDRNILIYTL